VIVFSNATEKSLIYDTIINFLSAFFISVLFWSFGIWTSADAKLFSVFALIIPTTTYVFGFMPYFPSASILINTFVPFFLFYFFRLLLFTSTGQKFKILKESLVFSKILSLMVSIFVFDWCLKLLSSYLAPFSPVLSLLFQNYFFSIVILASAFLIVEKTAGLKFLYVSIIVALARFILDRNIYSLDFLLYYSGIILLFFFSRYLILGLAYEVYRIKYDLHLLQQGMVPAENIMFDGKRYIRVPEMHYSLFSYAVKSGSKKLLNRTGSGLTEENIKLINKLKKTGKIKFNHLAVHQSLPFAPFLFVGSLITFLVKGNLFIFLQSIL